MSPPDRVPEQEELKALMEERARQTLERPDDHEPRLPAGFIRQLRLWHYPAFEPHRAWTVYQGSRPLHPAMPLQVRRVAWDREAELERFSGELTFVERARIRAPLLTVTDASLPEREWQALLEEARRVRAPWILAVNPSRASTDGEWFGLEQYGPEHFMRVEWHNQPAGPWEELAAWAARLCTFLETQLESARKP